uniref:Uncharacterized protein n=1 Tax=Timema poppense TaxID=170557 RepID=A0A7R9D2W9_TIMPO|nr:unnamed protein product [Timema poppensis]
MPLTAPKPSGRALLCRAFNLSLVFSNKPYATPGPQLPLPSAIRPTRQDEKPNLKRKIMDAIEGVLLTYLNRLYHWLVAAGVAKSARCKSVTSRY